MALENTSMLWPAANAQETWKPRHPLALDEALALMEGDAGLLRDLLDLFFETAPLNIAKIEEAVGAGDLETLVRQVHSLKGSAASVGADDLGSLARALEEYLQTGELNRVGPLASRLAPSLERLQEAVAALEWPGVTASGLPESKRSGPG